MKSFKVFSLVCTLSSVAFCASEVYYIKAYGEFGKELSQMAEKYAKEKNQTVMISIDEDPRAYKDSRILKIGVDKSARYSKSLGKELYEQRCASCHGKDAEKRIASTTALKDLSADDIESSIIAYRNDTSFGGSMRSVMKTQADTISNSDLGAIIAYLKGNGAYLMREKDENMPVSTQKKQGSYLR